MFSLASDHPVNAASPERPSADVRFCPVLSASNATAAQNVVSSDKTDVYDESSPGHPRTSPSDDAPHAPNDALLPQPVSQPSQPASFDIHRLTALQLRAVDLLLAGFPVVQVAETLHVSDRTIRRWKSAQPEFIAEYNRRVAEHSTLTAARLRQLADTAVAHVETILAGPDLRLKTIASLRILSCLISRNLAHFHGPVTAQEVLAEFLKQRLRAYNEDDSARLTSGMAEDYLTELSTFLEREQQQDEQERTPQAGRS